ncbi:hypothetical protein M514_02386 [Trichuris suis]|uniref:Uncharacterized protein n=1 Tax=Trichuris suis TaxID=68888 RepID=A0A085MHL4_9BILA|nr:hypothetical protein M513_02386 [Trichuris suis]KFD60140.1 hypothetical protein M514_02386 [Trichuris suis]
MQKALGSSAVAEHAVACRKTAIDLSASVLHRELHHKRREIIEALYVRHNRTIDKDDGYAVSEAWLPLTAAHMCFHVSPPEPLNPTVASIAEGLTPSHHMHDQTGHRPFL